MEGEGEVGSLDLSHLTEEEQSAILQVLQRDLDLRRHDEERVRVLQDTETDVARLRSMSGSWFSEERSKRHLSRMATSDLIHATIRHRKTKSNDVPLSELFNGGMEETTQSDNVAPEAESSQRTTEEESAGSQGSLHKSTHTPRSRSPATQEESDSLNEDSDSLNSGLTETYPASLKTSSSYSSLHSSYTLSASMMSLFSSGVFGVVEVRGRIQFSLLYDTQKEELQVKVYRCEDISSVCETGSDPYVKTYLLPDKSSHSKRKTSVKKRTLNPVYDQMLRYKVRISELRSRTLNLSVWHSEPLGRNMFLGEVEVALGPWDWTCTQPLWQDLQPRFYLSPDSISSRGTIILSIKFIPDGFEGGGLPLTGELHIWLREAQGLLSNKGGAIDSFVKSYILPEAGRQSGQKTRVVKHSFPAYNHTMVYILPDASRQSGQKTRVVKRSISPRYNHTMVYDGFQTSDLREACAEITVWQREGLKSRILGGIRLSCGTGESYGEAVSWMDSTDEEVSVWTSVIKNPNQWIEATLPIRANLTHRPQ